MRDRASDEHGCVELVGERKKFVSGVSDANDCVDLGGLEQAVELAVDLLGERLGALGAQALFERRRILDEQKPGVPLIELLDDVDADEVSASRLGERGSRSHGRVGFIREVGRNNDRSSHETLAWSVGQRLARFACDCWFVGQTPNLMGTRVGLSANPVPEQ